MTNLFSSTLCFILFCWRDALAGSASSRDVFNSLQDTPLSNENVNFSSQLDAQYTESFREKLNAFYSHPFFTGLHCNGSTLISLDRNNLLDSLAAMIFPISSPLKCPLYIKFKNEDAIDAGGVTREFFDLVSKDVFNPQVAPYFCYSPNKENRLEVSPLIEHRMSHGSSVDEKMDTSRNLYVIGKLIGMAIYHRVVLNVRFVPPFYKLILKEKLTLEDLKDVDFSLYQQMLNLKATDVSGLGLDFTFLNPNAGSKAIELITHDQNILVTNANKDKYIESFVEWRLLGKTKHAHFCILSGLNQIVPQSLLRAYFKSKDIEFLIAGARVIDIQDWKAHTAYKGCSEHDQIAQWFWRCVENNFDATLHAALLKYVTGSSTSPLNGFRYLQDGKFTIVKKVGLNKFPEAHTCFNELVLTDFDDYQVFKERLTFVITHVTEMALH